VKIIKPKFWNNHNFFSLLLWPLTLITRFIILLKKSTIPLNPEIKSICVGNIYLGGTGKTQLVIKINELLKKKYKNFIIKKFYKNQKDEQELLNNQTNLILPKNRIQGLKKITKNKKNIAIFDDGLQDKSINYNISIVCFNSIAGVGNGHIIPAGPLRESLSELINYDAVFINGDKNKSLQTKIKKYNKKIQIFNGKYYIKNKKIFNLKSNYLAFCGIGTPESFFNLLIENKFKIEKKIIYPDHFNYSQSDIYELKRIAKQNNLKIITTEKDFTKVRKFSNFKVKFLSIDFRINKIEQFKKFLIKKL